MNERDEQCAMLDGTQPLAEDISLQLFNSAGQKIFESTGRWLHPLFELEDFLGAMALERADMVLHDKMAGRAAASLICRLGIKKCIVDTISMPAIEVFKRYGVDYSYQLLVDRIGCRTEELLTSAMELEQVYQMLCQRAGRQLQA